MSNKRIDQYPGATVPLGSADLLLVEQGGFLKSTSLLNLLTSRSLVDSSFSGIVTFNISELNDDEFVVREPVSGYEAVRFYPSTNTLNLAGGAHRFNQDGSAVLSNGGVVVSGSQAFFIQSGSGDPGDAGLIFGFGGGGEALLLSNNGYHLLFGVDNTCVGLIRSGTCDTAWGYNPGEFDYGTGFTVAPNANGEGCLKIVPNNSQTGNAFEIWNDNAAYQDGSAALLLFADKLGKVSLASGAAGVTASGKFFQKTPLGVTAYLTLSEPNITGVCTPVWSTTP